MRRASHAARKKAEADSAKAQEGRTNDIEDSPDAGIEQQAESSKMGESRGDVGGGILPDSDEPFPASKDTEESDATFSLSEEDAFLRSSLLTFLQNECTELENDSNKAMVGAPANEEDLSANSFGESATRANTISTHDLLTSLRDQIATDLRAPLPRDLMSPQSSEHPQSSSQMLHNSARLQTEIILSKAADMLGRLEAAQQLLQDLGLGPESSNSRQLSQRGNQDGTLQLQGRVLQQRREFEIFMHVFGYTVSTILSFLEIARSL